MGYYKQASWTSYIDGEYIISARKKVEFLENKIEDLQKRKKNLRNDENDRIVFQIDHLMKV